MNVSNKDVYDITASIVSYDSDASGLLHAIRSVTSSGLKTKLIVVENGAREDLKPMVLDHGCEYRFVGHNAGFGAAHNLAIKECWGLAKYHVVLNPDVYFGSDVLESLVSYMDANSAIGITMPRILYPDGAPQYLCKLLPTPADLLLRRIFVGPCEKLLQRRKDKYEFRGVDPKRTLSIPVLSGCFMLLRTEVFTSVGIFDERYFMYLEDVDLCRRIHRLFDVVYYPHVSVAHEYAKGSYKNWTLLGRHVKSACKYFSKWGWFFDSERDLINARALNQPQVHYSIDTFGALDTQTQHPPVSGYLLSEGI